MNWYFQHAVFRAGKKTKKITNVVTKLTKGEIPSGEKRIWEDETLVLPEDLPPSTTTKAVQIKYTLTVWFNDTCYD